MTDQPFSKPEQPKPMFDTEQLRETMENFQETLQNSLKSQPLEVQQNVEKAQSFYMRNRPVILTVAATVVLFKIEKRMITKIVRKDSLITKDHLRQLTVALEDVAMMVDDKRFGSGTFLRSVVDSK